MLPSSPLPMASSPSTLPVANGVAPMESHMPKQPTTEEWKPVSLSNLHHVSPVIISGEGNQCWYRAVARALAIGLEDVVQLVQQSIEEIVDASILSRHVFLALLPSASGDDIRMAKDEYLSSLNFKTMQWGGSREMYLVSYACKGNLRFLAIDNSGLPVKRYAAEQLDPTQAVREITLHHCAYAPGESFNNHYNAFDYVFEDGSVHSVWPYCKGETKEQREQREQLLFRAVGSHSQDHRSVMVDLSMETEAAEADVQAATPPRRVLPVFPPRKEDIAEIRMGDDSRATIHNPGDPLCTVIASKELIKRKKVASGGFAVVFSAFWKHRGVKVAMKVFKKNRHMQSNFEEELSILKALPRHSSIIQMYGTSTIGKSPCIVFEWMHHESVLQYMKNTPLADVSMKQQVGYILQCVQALKHLHEQVPILLHCDFKCENLLMDEEGNIKVGDFGISSRGIGGGSVGKEEFIDGTIKSMAPELLNRLNHATAASDVFALGVVMWEILSWKEAYSGLGWTLDYDATVQRFVVGSQRLVIPVNAPPELQQLISECWHQDPQQRPSCAQVEEQVSIVLQSMSRVSGTPGGQQRTTASIKHFVIQPPLSVGSAEPHMPSSLLLGDSVMPHIPVSFLSHQSASSPLSSRNRLATSTEGASSSSSPQLVMFPQVEADTFDQHSGLPETPDRTPVTLTLPPRPKRKQSVSSSVSRHDVPRVSLSLKRKQSKVCPVDGPSERLVHHDVSRMVTSAGEQMLLVWVDKQASVEKPSLVIPFWRIHRLTVNSNGRDVKCVCHAPPCSPATAYCFRFPSFSSMRVAMECVYALYAAEPPLKHFQDGVGPAPAKGFANVWPTTSSPRWVQVIWCDDSWSIQRWEWTATHDNIGTKRRTQFLRNFREGQGQQQHLYVFQVKQQQQIKRAASR